MTALASGVLALALVVFVVGAPRDFRAALGLTTELLLAAGLLRLAAVDSYPMLAAVAAIVVVRRIIRFGLQSAPR